MKTRNMILAALFLLLPAFAAVAEEAPTLNIRAWDFSDPALEAASGDSCAEFLAYLTGPYMRYKLLGIANIQGPPGVVYTLRSYSGEIAIIKCSATGSEDHEDGGCGG